MTPNRDYVDARKPSAQSISDEEQEREAYLNEVTQRSTQFGCNNWQYEATFDFNDK